jgi:hypothetical protein
MGFLPDSRRRDRFVSGTYHTDGRRLLRIVCEAANGAQRAVEDCKTMELVLVPVQELESLDLRPVPR